MFLPKLYRTLATSQDWPKLLLGSGVQTDWRKLKVILSVIFILLHITNSPNERELY